MTQVERQATQDAKDHFAGHSVRCPYDAVTQPEKYDAWFIAFNRKLIELEIRVTL